MNFQKLILFFLLISCINKLDAQSIDSEWALVNNIENIKVYTKKNKNDSFKEIRIIAELTGDVKSLLSKINNPDSYTDWVYKCTNGESLNRISQREFYYYIVSDFPFPTQDRDMVVLCKQWVDTDGTIYSNSVAQPNFIPAKKGLVRIPKFESHWKITPNYNGKILIDYTAISDPGGSIPAWMVNLAITTGPLATMKKLIASVTYPNQVLIANGE